MCPFLVLNANPCLVPTERIAEQKFAVRTLVILYRNSVDIPGRSDTLRAGGPEKGTSLNPRKFFKRAMKGVRQAATTTTTAFGNVAVSNCLFVCSQ